MTSLPSHPFCELGVGPKILDGLPERVWIVGRNEDSSNPFFYEFQLSLDA
jgi:hypothetical protein